MPRALFALNRDRIRPWVCTPRPPKTGARHKHHPRQEIARRGHRRGRRVSLLAALFASAGTAHAGTNPASFANQDGSLEVVYGGGGVALYATIVDVRNPQGATEVCHYHLVGVMNTPGFPMTTTPRSPGNSASYSPVVY